MKRPALMLLNCLATILACTASVVVPAAGGAAAAQDLAKVRASDLVMAAVWARQPDAYTLKVVLDRAKHTARQAAIVAANKERLASSPQPVLAAPPPGDGIDHGSYFIRDTIASLRGVDPWFHCGRIPRLIDGRRGSQAAPAPVPANPLDSREAREHKVEVWLLRSDGTQILPEAYSCVPDPDAVEVVYTFPAADSQKAVAAAIRIEGDYYIEKLQALEPEPAPGSR